MGEHKFSHLFCIHTNTCNSEELTRNSFSQGKHLFPTNIYIFADKTLPEYGKDIRL